ncbi:hypothetical protein FHR67_000006 [Xanthomonas arboricola]|nr:hypothetical protein [Xanthomonas campestris]
MSAVPDQARIVVSGRAASPVRSPDTPHAKATASHMTSNARLTCSDTHSFTQHASRCTASKHPHPASMPSASIAQHRRSNTHRTGIIHLCPQLAAR